MLDDFVEQNIDRLIKQCNGGDEAITFLAIYSFIEGFFREKYPNDFKWEKDIKFHQIIDLVKSRHLATSFPAESTLYDTLKKYHGEKDKNAYKNLKTFTDTNRVRHCFSNIREGTLSVIVDQFIEFARYRGFLTDEITDMNNSDSVMKSRKSIKLIPSDDSLLYHLKNDFLTQYESFLNYRKEKEILESELEQIDSQLIETTDEIIIHKLIREKKEKTNSLKEIETQSSKWQEYSNYMDELAISLIESRSKKKVETQIIHLSDAQKKLIKEDIDALTTKEGHSMYIKGGPGTGKTLVLIVILFRFFSSQRTSVLLTYYPTLNKYISYLFELYNDDKLLNYFGISRIEADALENLGTTGILKFDDFLLPKIKKHLRVQNIYSIKDKISEITEIFQTVEPDHQKAAKLYEDVIENVLPNMLDEKKYCINPRRTEKWNKISKILEILDNSQNMLDLYAYYKFGLKDIDKIALTNESFDYILIDEAQDLTNAQIFAINKFVNNRGGLILAGDPSQEIRNKKITMAQLDVNIAGGARYSQELTLNFRSSKLIQDLGNEYKQEPCLHIRKNTKSVDGITAGPPPQIFITNDDESSNYKDTINQIITSVKMCVEELCIAPENICIVAFNEPELKTIQGLLLDILKIKSVLIYKDFSFKNKDDANGKIRLCTLKEIKGIDCAVLLFMITDQSKQVNCGEIKSELKANAIYTCITRAMYLLQVFVPKYCRMSDLSVAVLVNKMLPEDDEVANYIEEQRKKELKGIPLREYFEKYKNQPESEILKKIETALKQFYEIKFGSSDNCYIDITQDCGMARVYSIKRVVSEVQDSLTEISVEEARLIRPDCKIGDDDIYVYVNPSELIIEQKEANRSDGKEYIRILTEAYEKYPDRRTDKLGNPLGYSNEGYLNIAGCGLAKPYEFGYEKWPELIKDNLDTFDFVIYDGKGTVKIFAYRPKVLKTQIKTKNESFTSDIDYGFIEKGWFLGKITESEIVVVNQYRYVKPDGTYSWRSIKDIVSQKPKAYIKESLYNTQGKVGDQIEFSLNKLDVPITVMDEALYCIVNDKIIMPPTKKASLNETTIINALKKNYDIALQKDSAKPLELRTQWNDDFLNIAGIGKQIKDVYPEAVEYIKKSYDSLKSFVELQSKDFSYTIVDGKFFYKPIDAGNIIMQPVLKPKPKVVVVRKKTSLDNIYTNTIIGPYYGDPDCITVNFSDPNMPRLHFVKINRANNQEDLFARCERGVSIKYKVHEIAPNTYEAIIIEVLV